MTTSKVKTVHEIKEWGEGDRKTYYHNLEMENGDKINIGRKKKEVPGNELNYEFEGEVGQHDFTKAKIVYPEFNPTGKPDSYASNLDRHNVQLYIVRQSSLNRAIEHLSYKDHDQMTKENVTALAEYYTKWVMS